MQSAHTYNSASQSFTRTRHLIPAHPKHSISSRRSASQSSSNLSSSQLNHSQAESEVSDKAKREELDAVIKQARLLVLKGLNPPLPASTPDNDPALKGLVPSFRLQVRAQSKELLIDEEVRRRKAIKMNLANEGLEARKKDEEIASRKRKVEEDKQWEGELVPPTVSVSHLTQLQREETLEWIVGATLLKARRRRRQRLPSSDDV